MAAMQQIFVDTLLWILAFFTDMSWLGSPPHKVTPPSLRATSGNDASIWQPCKSGACCNPYSAVTQYCPGNIACQPCGGGSACQCPSEPSPTPSTTIAPPTPTPTDSSSGMCTSIHSLNCAGDDLTGGHLTGVTTHMECCNACTSFAGCSAWSWHYTTADCYLKSACTDKQTYDASYHSGYSTSSPAPTPVPFMPTPAPTPSAPTPTISPTPSVGPAKAEPNPPIWPSSVHIFSPSSGNIQAAINAAASTNYNEPGGTCNNGQFSEHHYAFLFLPGTYTVDVPVGYYTSVAGTGRSPTDVVFAGDRGVHAQESCGDYSIGALNSFWRSAENFHTKSQHTWTTGTGMMWAVSQASPIRNVKVDHDLVLYQYWPKSCCEAGYASGGWASGIDLGGKAKFGSQQQWVTRNSQGAFDGNLAAWSNAFMGVQGAPVDKCGRGSVNTLTSTPLVAEKPYVSSQDGSAWSLIVPRAKQGSSGAGWSDAVDVHDFSNVYVTQPGDSAAHINAKLAGGLHVVITPGTYTLEDTIRIVRPGQVVLGLGIPILISPPTGGPCVQVADVAGVRVAGLLLQAGPHRSEALLTIGKSGSFVGSQASPTVITDVFARVGGPELQGVGPVTAMFLIQSQWVVIDNTWLWRADHGPGGVAVTNYNNPVDHGLLVMPFAEHVYAYGLASEHTLKDNVMWQANHGTVFFMQAEIMYDASAGTWPYSCYTVSSGVTKHTATGVGCYSYFRDHAAWCDNGISVPQTDMVQGPFSIFLNGNGGIRHVINGQGPTCQEGSQQCYYCAGMGITEAWIRGSGNVGNVGNVTLVI